MISILFLIQNFCSSLSPVLLTLLQICFLSLLAINYSISKGQFGWFAVARDSAVVCLLTGCDLDHFSSSGLSFTSLFTRLSWLLSLVTNPAYATSGGLTLIFATSGVAFKLDLIFICCIHCVVTIFLECFYLFQGLL